MKKEQKILIKKIISKAEFLFTDDKGIRCCIWADEQTSETERAIALACGLSFAGIEKLKTDGHIQRFFVDDECLHIVISIQCFEEFATKSQVLNVEEA